MKNINEMIKDLVAYVFSKHKVDVDTIKIDDYDYDLDSVYINNDTYMLSMWNIYTGGRVKYTLYKIIGDVIMPIGTGTARTSKHFARFLEEDAERKYIEYMKTQYNEDWSN